MRLQWTVHKTERTKSHVDVVQTRTQNQEKKILNRLWQIIKTSNETSKMLTKREGSTLTEAKNWKKKYILLLKPAESRHSRVHTSEQSSGKQTAQPSTAWCRF